jgi:SprT protein
MQPDSPLDQSARTLLNQLSAAHPLGYTPSLQWRNLRVTAGLAYYKEGLIVLSRLVLTDEARMEITLRHEYAHLLAVARHGRKGAGHGVHWQQAMRELGVQPKVRHNYEVERNERRQEVTYRCARCNASFNRHRRLPRKRKWVHAGCGGPLRLESVKRITEPVNSP